MYESKIYFLPVFKNSNFEGIVTVNRVFRATLKKNNLARKLELRTKKDLLVIQKDATLTEAYNLMKDKQVARLPVVGRQGKLVGIVTRFDLRAALSEPKEKVSWLSRAGDKKKYLDHPLEGYYKKIVVVARPDSPVNQFIEKMLEKQVGSIVILDSNRKPVGIVSNYDILKAISKLKPKKGAEVDLKIDEKFVHKVRLEQILSRFVSKVGKFSPIRRVGFIVETIKNPAGKIKRYTIHAHLFLKNGREVVARVTAYDWKKAVRKTLNKIRRQLPS
jgi:CBS domain-containing protein